MLFAVSAWEFLLTVTVLLLVVLLPLASAWLANREEKKR
jgi:uncharacterized membrane protein